MKHTRRAVVAVVMLVGFYAYGLLVLLGLGWLLVHATTHWIPDALSGTGALAWVAVKGGVVLVLVAVALLGGLFGRRREPEPAPPAGVLLTRQDQPLLWSVVRDLADRVGTRPPDEIRLVATVNAGVTEDATRLGLRPGTRRMVIGAPLVTTFSQAELVSVLAHELGHYGGRHTALGGLVYRSREAIGRTLDRLEPHPVVRAVVGLYARLYLAVSAATSRAQEVEADRLSVEVSGPATATRALLSVGPLGAAWDYFVESYALAAREDGLHPTDLFGGFEMFLGSPERQEQLVELAATTPPAPTHWADSHPSVEERVAAMEQVPVADLVEPSPPAVELLGDYLAALHALETELFAGSGLTPTSWDEVAHAGARRTWDTLSGLVSAAAREHGGEPHLGGVLDGVANGTFGSHVAALVVDPEAAPEARRELLDAVCRSALVAAGARARISWSGPADLTGPHGEALDPAPLVAAALEDPAGVDALRAWLAAHGASLDHVADQPATRDGRTELAAQPPELVSVIGRVRCRGAFRSGGLCFLLTHGLVMRTFDGAESFASLGSPRALVSVAARRRPEELLSDRKACVLRWDDIRGAHAFTEGRRQRVRLDLVDGRTLVLKWLMDTQDDPRFLPALAYLLGDRFHAEEASVATA